ncbi:DUF1027 domain-containing protein [Brevibacillus sp. SYP-B805]|uniref:YutD family protein n=1 Tax=Brevibacillus sp. SYP-B805 TaxID=1578199 RepID=UPI0013EC2376|nr:YutD family protein [Brevibacillus sp. SYP-B805]NGQ96944.1 DUF1027 domain-containing protein [Brevibacillus sp. SYP-B805]
MIRTQAGVFELVEEYRGGWNQEAFKERYSDILDKYDYVVGDWGYGQLRLRGFYDSMNRKVPFEQRIDYLDEYLQEFCNFGCPYFVLHRVKGARLPEGAGSPTEAEESAQERQERFTRYERPERYERQSGNGDRRERPGRPSGPRGDREDRQSAGQQGKQGQARSDRTERLGKPRQEQPGRDKGKGERPSKERRGMNQYRPNREKVSTNSANNENRP